MALFHVGLWQALTANNVNRASGHALTRILTLPWMLFALFLMFIALTAMRGGGMDGIGLIVIWAGISLGVDFFFGFRARTRLEEEFRTQAMARYAPPRSLWQKLFGSSSST